MTKYSAYIDTTILGNWVLYYKNRKAVDKAGKKVIESFQMLQDIEKHVFTCVFVTSTWAMCELASVILDNILAEEMKKNEISLTQFSSQKRIFKIEDENKIRLIVENLGDFRNFLKGLDIRIRSFEVDDDAVTDLLMKHTFLEAPDALHLSFVIRSCDVLVTLDERHFLDAKHKKQIQDADGISVLRPCELTKDFRKLPRSLTCKVTVKN